ncbi:unnamed protein product, partial [Prunus brigantina]
MDSALVVTLIMNPATADTHLLAGLLYGCWDLMKKISHYAIQDVYRERNYVVDRLANGNYNMDLGMRMAWFDSAPPWTAEALADDLLGVSRPRSIRLL